MAHVTIRIRCDNAAFDPDPEQEVGRILRRLAGNIGAGYAADAELLFDVNGNMVGEYQLYE